MGAADQRPGHLVSLLLATVVVGMVLVPIAGITRRTTCFGPDDSACFDAGATAAVWSFAILTILGGLALWRLRVRLPFAVSTVAALAVPVLWLLLEPSFADPTLVDGDDAVAHAGLPIGVVAGIAVAAAVLGYLPVWLITSIRRATKDRA